MITIPHHKICEGVKSTVCFTFSNDIFILFLSFCIYLQSEAPLMIRPFIADMTMSELHAILTGGFATIAGSVMAAYILYGVSNKLPHTEVQHLIFGWFYLKFSRTCIVLYMHSKFILKLAPDIFLITECLYSTLYDIWREYQIQSLCVCVCMCVCVCVCVYMCLSVFPESPVR